MEKYAVRVANGKAATCVAKTAPVSRELKVGAAASCAPAEKS